MWSCREWEGSNLPSNFCGHDQRQGCCTCRDIRMTELHTRESCLPEWFSLKSPSLARFFREESGKYSTIHGKLLERACVMDEAQPRLAGFVQKFQPHAPLRRCDRR